MKSKSFYLFATALICSSGIHAQQSADSDPLKSFIPMQINWDSAKPGDDKNPVVKLKFVSYKTEQKDGKTFTSYYVYAAGLPQNQSFTMLTWPIVFGTDMPQFEPGYSGLYVNKKNVLLCAKPEGDVIDSDAPAIDPELRLNMIVATAKAEPLRVALLSEKQEIVAMGTLINRPLEASDKACHVQVIRALGGSEILLVEGTGFTPRSKVVLSREDSRGNKSATFTTDASGRIETALVMMAPGLMKGTATVTIKDEGCAPGVKFNWGHDTYKIE